MLSLHFNGDLVQHPDAASNYRRRVAMYDETGRCKHGQKEIYCPAYMKYIKDRPEIKKISEFPRCMLTGDKCPHAKILKERGKIKKEYCIDNKTYRKIASAGHYLIRTSKHKTIFITLTFPKFKKAIQHEELNTYFSRFMENLRTNYNCAGYVAVRELGDINNRPHFHVICSMPFIDYRLLNSVWVNTIQDICYFAPNALQTTRKKSVIYDHAGALRYVCKYFAKARLTKSESRIVFISHNILQPAQQFRVEAECILNGHRSIYIRHYDYTTIYSITDAKAFQKFAEDVIYPAFNLIHAGNRGMYIYKEPG
jgi:hypothetical protein